MKRTYQPHNRKRINKHGFRSRILTADGRKVLKRRRAKGRKFLTVSDQILFKGNDFHGKKLKNTVNIRKQNRVVKVSGNNKLNSTTCRKAGM